MLTRTAEGYELDWQGLKSTVGKAVTFLDNVIEMNKYPIEQIEKVTKSTGRLDLASWDLPTWLIRLGIPYNSEEAVDIAEELMSFIQRKGREATRELASDRGAFPNFKGSIYRRQGRAGEERDSNNHRPHGTICHNIGLFFGHRASFRSGLHEERHGRTELIEVNPYSRSTRRKGALTALR